MAKSNWSKTHSLVFMALLYAFATGLGALMFWIMTSPKCGVVAPDILALLAADLIAMLFVWIYDIIYENVSVYDPYWSFAPPVMFTLYALHEGQFTLPVVLLLLAVLYWGIRLTCNWARSFKGMGHEDWRYAGYRAKLPGTRFELLHFSGFVLMPTLLVFACMLPGFRMWETGAPANGITWLGFALCLAAATIQLVADNQSHRFRAANPGRVCNFGLWKHGRHPNYFGEILMWWGVWTMYASFFGLDWLVLAPVAMTALFLFVSIPMMEHRQLENKPAYAEYRKSTRILL